MAGRSNVASGVLLLVVGAWLAMQAMVGDLPRRIIAYRSNG